MRGPRAVFLAADFFLAADAFDADFFLAPDAFDADFFATATFLTPVRRLAGPD
jgi:hypothetical protein